jgi:hypothetical protein
MPVVPDLDLAAVHDDRHAALAAGELQHLRHAGSVPQHVHVLDRDTFALVGFTSRPGVGSGVLAEDQNLGAHASLLGAALWPASWKAGAGCSHGQHYQRPAGLSMQDD